MSQRQGLFQADAPGHPGPSLSRRRRVVQTSDGYLRLSSASQQVIRRPRRATPFGRAPIEQDSTDTLPDQDAGERKLRVGPPRQSD